MKESRQQEWLFVNKQGLLLFIQPYISSWWKLISNRKNFIIETLKCIIHQKRRKKYGLNFLMHSIKHCFSFLFYHGTKLESRSEHQLEDAGTSSWQVPSMTKRDSWTPLLATIHLFFEGMYIVKTDYISSVIKYTRVLLTLI